MVWNEWGDVIIKAAKNNEQPPSTPELDDPDRNPNDGFLKMPKKPYPPHLPQGVVVDIDKK